MFIVRGKAINVQYIFFLWFPIVFAYVNMPALPFSKKMKKPCQVTLLYKKLLL